MVRVTAEPSMTSLVTAGSPLGSLFAWVRTAPPLDSPLPNGTGRVCIFMRLLSIIMHTLDTGRTACWPG